MILWKSGDLFMSTCGTLGCPVNTKSVMGAGLAKEFARRFPGLEAAYKKACRSGALGVGTPWLWSPDGAEPTKVLCIATKDHWKQPSEYLYIEQAAEWIAKNHEAAGIKELALPALGCGLGGLEWHRVKGILERYLWSEDLKLKLEVYEP